MWSILRQLGLYVLVIFFFSACLGDSGGGPSTPRKKSVLDFDYSDNPVENKSDTVDVGSGLSGEDLMNPEQRKKYEALQRKKEQLESWIDDKERERMSIQIERMRPIGPDHGDAIKRNLGSAALSANDPQLASVDRITKDPISKKMVRTSVDLTKLKLKRLDWQEEECTNEIKVFRKELAVIENEIDRLKNEAKKTCFNADTQILLANGKSKKISEIKINDEVMIYDIAKDKISSDRVKEIYVSDNNHMYVINRDIMATAYERFLTKRKGWLKIRDLKVGDEIFDGNSFQKIDSIYKIKKIQKVYNLNISSKHNFFASNSGKEFFLIHNCSGGSGGASGGGK